MFGEKSRNTRKNFLKVAGLGVATVVAGEQLFQRGERIIDATERVLAVKRDGRQMPKDSEKARPVVTEGKPTMSPDQKIKIIPQSPNQHEEDGGFGGAEQAEEPQSVTKSTEDLILNIETEFPEVAPKQNLRMTRLDKDGKEDETAVVLSKEINDVEREVGIIFIRKNDSGIIKYVYLMPYTIFSGSGRKKVETSLDGIVEFKSPTEMNDFLKVFLRDNKVIDAYGEGLGNRNDSKYANESPDKYLQRLLRERGYDVSFEE